MLRKHFRYEYKLSTRYPQEYEAVNFSYLQAGWKEIDFRSDDAGFPTHIIFEWPLDRPPIYPSVNWP